MRNYEFPNIDELLGQLEARKELLTALVKEKEQALKKTPEGTLKIHRRKKFTEFYQQIEKDKNVSRKYLKPTDRKLITSLAQKAYDKEILVISRKELHVLEKLLPIYPGMTVEKYYGELGAERKEMVVPISKTDEQYRAEWEAFQYTGRDFTPDTPVYLTDKGERVRSKSEVLLANMLAKADIPYRYECPLKIKGFGTIFPDFTCLNLRRRKEFYWEHLGMMDDAEYSGKAVKKINSYESSGIHQGISLLLSCETKDIPIDQKVIQEMIDTFLK